MDVIKAACKVLVDDNNVFSAAQDVVDMELYKKMCMFDTCACIKSNEGSCADAKCASFAEAARVASHKGIILHWRSDVLCRK